MMFDITCNHTLARGAGKDPVPSMRCMKKRLYGLIGKDAQNGP